MRLKSRNFIMLLAVISVMSSYTSVYANKTTDLKISVVPTELNIALPIAVPAVLDPNKAIDKAFTSPRIEIQNNTLAPIKVRAKLNGIKYGAVDMVPVDKENATYKDKWETLNNTDSKKYISLGFKKHPDSANNFKDLDSWFTGLTPGVQSEIELGSIISTKAKDGKGYVEMQAKHGMSFEKSETITISVTFIASLL